MTLVPQRVRSIVRAAVTRFGLAPLIAFFISTGALFALGFAPLFDGPGYEISLAAGLVVPACAAIATALDRAAAIQNTKEPPLDSLLRGVAIGAAFGLAGFLTTLIHGARAGFCDFWSGATNFALGPFVGAILGGTWGAVAGEIASRRAKRWARRTVAVLVAFAGPLAGAAVSFGRFLTSPMVFAYDPFAGYFSGTLYDTVIDASGLWTYRAGSLATMGAALVLAMHLRRSEEDGKLRLRWARSWGVALTGVLCAIVSVAHMSLGTELGHYQTAASIAKALGGRTDGERCVVLHPRGMSADETGRFVRDCDAHVRRLERWFEAPGPAKITVYLFADVHQKASLMGASDTQIAKPWRREVYVQDAPYPHPVIGHELAHVIAGAFARGPFETAGDVDGFLPNPGLIEGVAVAASPREGDLSPSEWAKAMKDLGILPKLHDLFGLGFLGASSGVAYTVSGAFVDFVKDTYGAAAVRAWYGGQPLPQVTGASWADLEARFLAALDALPLTDAARAQAKARFDRPGLFARRCPHQVDLCKGRAEALRSGGDEIGALSEYATVRRLDPGDQMVRVQIARTKIRAGGDVAAGSEELRAILADRSIPQHVRDRALEDLADLALSPGGDGAFAAASFRELMSRTVDEDQLRTLEVKAMAAETPLARDAVFYFLVGPPGHGQEKMRAGESFGLWEREAPEDGTPHYLLARYFVVQTEYREALRRLDLALARKLPTARVEVEAWRLRIVASCAVGDPNAARSAYDAYRSRPGVPKARRDAMAALIERCAEAGTAPAKQ
ncbi:MAG: hypothetical protein U0441_25470 [Polyangiaceae bacterium]